KKILAGKISTTQNYVRETANIEVLTSEVEASEGFGAITYKWTIKKQGSADSEDLGISTSSCDISTKTFADYGMVSGDIVYFNRYATDELGTEVLASKTVKLLSSVAFVAPTDKSYIISATIQETGPNPDFKLINGEIVNATSTNVGAKLVAVNIGGFRNPKYVLAAELAPSRRAPIVSDVTYSYVNTEKYNIQYTIDPINYTYSLAVKHIDSTNFVTLTEDQVYYKIGDVSNNVDFTHFDPRNFSVEDFKIISTEAGSIKTVDQDMVYSDESFGQIKQVEEATGYENVYYTWEYGVVGEDMIVSTVTYDSGYPYDGDNDGTQDTDENGKLLYYNVTGTFLNVNKVLGTVFGAPKTVTVIRYANDVDGVLGQTSTSLDIEVIV
ncbi:MAG: hypothetical protein KAG37_03550, partial [Flavobacteriales bacterium]|nr:hypothetical protein [Flavobacteriales bacterium]